MALAFLQYKGRSNGFLEFRADIGTSKYFRYVLGEKRTKRRTGKNEFIELVDGNKKRSSLMQINEAMNKINHGTFPLRIPANEIDQDTKYVQLYSYSRRASRVPNVSNIVRIYTLIGRKHRAMEYAESASITEENKTQRKMEDTVVKNKSFNYREPQLSKVMFWNTIVNALPGIVKHAAPVLGELLGGGNSGAAANGAQGGSPQTNQVLNQVVEMLKAIANNSANAANPPTQGSNAAPSQPPTNGTSSPQSLSYFSTAYALEPETLVALGPVLEKILSPEAILAIGDDPQKLFMAIKDTVLKTEEPQENHQQDEEKRKKTALHANGQYSEAKVAPALLAALPALMPVIEKVLNPQTIEAIGNQPTKIFKAIGDAVLKMDEQEIKHLEAINPGVDSADDIAKLLQGMSISTAYQEDIIRFKLITNLNLNFVHSKTVNFKNKDRILYVKNQRISLPFEILNDAGVHLQKSLKKSIIQIVIKDAESMKMVFRKNIKLVDVNIGQEIHEAFLLPEEIAQIPCNTELKLEVSHIWKSNKNQNLGVFKCHYIHFIDSYIYDRIGEEVGQSIPFNDIHAHRRYWHKIWEGGFSKSNRWHVEFDLKYFYLLNSKETDMARLETRKLIASDNVDSAGEYPKRRKILAKLKSGFELGLPALNSILKILNQEILNPDELKVLKKSSISKDFQQVARQRVEMKGREGDTATLWAYPEISLYKLIMSKAGAVDNYGQVLNLEPVEKVIPRPSLIHFIGTKSEH